MKKSLGKRLISGVTSLLIGMSAFTQAVPLGNGGVLKAKAVEGNSPKYSKEYTVENLLTDYNIVSFGDLYMNTHTVGAVLAGGTVSSSVSNGGTFGDGAKAFSYFGNIEKIGRFNGNAYFKDEYANDFALYSVYYLNCVEDAQNEIDGMTYIVDGVEYPSFVKVDEPYFDAVAAKNAITTWSEGKSNATDAWVVSESDLEVIDMP